MSALERASKPLDSLTAEDLAPVDHFHARGLPATVELADRLPVEPADDLLDIGCGLGGPARYFAQRFGCRVTGIDITGPFVVAANKLTALLGMGDQVVAEQGDGERLPYEDASFDAAYAQHVTMNVADRRRFFGEAWRVLKPGGFFALTEHGLGPVGSPHHPVPWSEDGTGEFLVTPSETRELLAGARFVDIETEDTGAQYLAAYRGALELADRGELPPLGLHVLMGPTAIEKLRNSARNIDERRTHPVRIVCRKPS
ncbi:MAG TPA: class I SAM-dependent methyltransferase [Solirubrobacteraceae bacterium]|nr:class I SAM-dependent methyltransferase [Solirubrobacteraceae bacterium]